MPAVLDDPELRLRLARVYAECGNSYTEAARLLGLDKHTVRRLLLQRHGPVGKTRARLELALSAFELRAGREKRTRKTTKTPQTLPDLAEEVLRYVLEAVEARRVRSHEA